MTDNSWNSFITHQPILRALQELQFSAPTEIQRQAIPLAINEQKDILGAAPTGSGKTLAFGIPVLRFIDRIRRAKPEPKLRALILAPTRELVIQIKAHLDDVGKYTHVRSVTIIGGMSVQKQQRLLSQKPDIVIATPGRLWEMIEEGDAEHISPDSLRSIKFLVVDEFDKMIEKNHFNEMKKIVEILRKSTMHSKRQILVFSATLTYVFKTPERWKFDAKRANKQISLKSRIKQMKNLLGMKQDTQVIDLTQQGIGKPSRQQLAEFQITCLANEKDMYLYYILASCSGRTLIFCNSKDCIRRLVSILKHLLMDCIPMHAELDQKKRLKNLERFRSSPDKIMVASDVAARGLDIDQVERVIHYQVPRTVECYVHRSGRTARGVASGVSILLYEPQESKCYRNLISSMGKQSGISDYPIDRKLFDVARARVKVAQELNRIEHLVQKQTSEKNWFQRMADECEIDISDRHDILNKGQLDSKQQRQLKTLENQLHAMLKTPMQRYVDLNKYLDTLAAQKITFK